MRVYSEELGGWIDCENCRRKEFCEDFNMGEVTSELMEDCFEGEVEP